MTISKGSIVGSTQTVSPATPSNLLQTRLDGLLGLMATMTSPILRRFKRAETQSINTASPSRLKNGSMDGP